MYLSYPFRTSGGIQYRPISGSWCGRIFQVAPRIERNAVCWKRGKQKAYSRGGRRVRSSGWCSTFSIIDLPIVADLRVGRLALGRWTLKLPLTWPASLHIAILEASSSITFILDPPSPASCFINAHLLRHRHCCCDTVASFNCLAPTQGRSRPTPTLPLFAASSCNSQRHYSTLPKVRLPLPTRSHVLLCSASCLSRILLIRRFPLALYASTAPRSFSSSWKTSERNIIVQNHSQERWGRKG